jgi:hypothetical protein
MAKRTEITCKNRGNSVRRKAQNKNGIVTKEERNIKERNEKRATESEGRGEPNHSSDKTIEMSHALSELAIKP